MKIYEFISLYCQDLVEKNKTEKNLMVLEGLPRDGVNEDEDGKKIPYVLVDGECIPVADFITLERADFLKIWSSPGAPEAFDNYLSALSILEGEEALSRIRNAIAVETERLKQDVELLTSI